MKKIIIIFVALLVLAGGAFGGLFMTDNLALIGLAAEPTEEEAAAAKKKEEMNNNVKEDAVYIQLSQVVIPVIKGDRVAYQIYMDLNLEVGSVSDKNDVAMVMPRIQDAIMVSLVTQPIIDTEGFEKIDIKGLKRRLLATIQKAMGDKTVRQVLVTKVMRAG
jgi:flagellar basal body-associated protein FliL